MLIGIDRDVDALVSTKEKLSNYNNVKFIKGNHDEIKMILEDLNIQKVDGILLDLGISSYQIDEAKRGFSYIKEGPLDMRMDKEGKLDAKHIVNSYKEEDLVKIFFEYGEEKYSKSIANKICKYRLKKEIETTTELVNIIGNFDSTKRIFQALRIETNDELKPLYNTIKDSIECLNEKGRIAVITFHSLEDKVIKQAFIDGEGKCTCPKDLPYCVCDNKSLGKIITKKPIEPTEEEKKNNPRSISAKLRIFEKIT